MKRYRRYREDIEDDFYNLEDYTKDLNYFNQALDYFKNIALKNAKIDAENLSKIKTSIEVQKYHHLFDRFRFDLALKKAINELVSMEGVLPKNFIKSQLKKYKIAFGGSINTLMAKDSINQIESIIDIMNSTIDKLKNSKKRLGF